MCCWMRQRETTPLLQECPSLFLRPTVRHAHVHVHILCYSLPFVWYSDCPCALAALGNSCLLIWCAVWQTMVCHSPRCNLNLLPSTATTPRDHPGVPLVQIDCTVDALTYFQWDNYSWRHPQAILGQFIYWSTEVNFVPIVNFQTPQHNYFLLLIVPHCNINSCCGFSCWIIVPVNKWSSMISCVLTCNIVTSGNLTCM